LAEEYGPYAFGVSLSEPAWDGVLGLRAIQAHGGITFLEGSIYRRGEPPQNLMIAFDSVRPPAKIAEDVVRLARQPHGAPQFTADDLAEVRAVLMARSGPDCSIYDPRHLESRIGRRMVLGNFASLKEYCEQIRADQSEREALVGDLCGRQGGFFRDTAALEYVKTKLLPLILHARPSAAVRIWVPECAQGEEIYSVAIALLECMEDLGVRRPVQIFGTDLNEAALEDARAGVYCESVAGTLSNDRLARFFRRTYGGYRIIPALRAFCLFSKHNLAEDPPFPKLDLIVCRDVLPRLAAVAQRHALRGFHYALQPHGALLLGSSEEAGAPLFAKIKGRHPIYSRQDQSLVANAPSRLAAAHAAERDGNLPARVMQTLLSRFAPRFFVVDRDLRLLPLDGSLKEADLPRVVSGSLAAELQNLVYRAQRRGRPISGEVLRTAGSEAIPYVRPLVAPIESSHGEYYLVLLENAEPETDSMKPAGGSSRTDKQQLAEDLASVSAELQSMIDGQQAVIEELKVANEEIASGNEELVATNNELIFARGDLEANSRELVALNEEISARNNELVRLNRDLNGLLRNLSIPMITVGNDLRIRRYTQQIRCLLELTADDIGRPVGDLKTRFAVGDLEHRFREAVDLLKTTEETVRDENGRTYRLSIKPYRSEDNTIEGAILTLW
jgi:two-component system, chemotaxis family, CheB/CheR fusion protein